MSSSCSNTETWGTKRDDSDNGDDDDSVVLRKTAEMEMGLELGVRERDEEKHWGEQRGCRVRRVRVGSAREAAEVDMVWFWEDKG